jgi:hypothetical protein
LSKALIEALNVSTLLSNFAKQGLGSARRYTRFNSITLRRRFGFTVAAQFD